MDRIDKVALVEFSHQLESTTSMSYDFYTKLKVGAPPIPDQEFILREPIANSYSQEHISESSFEMLENRQTGKNTRGAKENGTLSRSGLSVQHGREKI